MTIKFYSFADNISTNDRRGLNTLTQNLDNELQTVLGDYELISMTSAATNGIVVTTIAYEDGEVSEK